MKTIEQIEQQIAELQADLAVLKAKPKEWPQIGDEYFHLDGAGDISKLFYGEWCGDSGSFIQGNAFRTQAEAEAERDARAVVAELRKQPGRNKFVVGGTNYSLSISLNDNNVDWDTRTVIDAGWEHTYFDSEESVQAAINAVGADRILKAARWWACGEC